MVELKLPDETYYNFRDTKIMLYSSEVTVGSFVT